jgi:3'-phosphoadenosine 5'-phosphosulfate sulfotransferase (PAPS reductase)/FAD synthetase
VTIQEAAARGDDPTVRHIVSISGGKDSAALAIYIKRHYPGIRAEYVFCDTGCELPETYEYLERLEALLGARVVHLSALDLLGIEKKPGRNPFDIWLNEVYGGFLPSPRTRWCTRVLKIAPFEKYIGTDQAFSYIGIRADENRDGYVAKKPPKISDQPNIIPVYPFKDDGLGIADIRAILEESGIGAPDYYRWRSRSGCYFCFYQQIGEWQGLLERHPELYEKAKAYESGRNGRRYTWVDGRSLADVEKMPRRAMKPKSDDDGCAICHL